MICHFLLNRRQEFKSQHHIMLAREACPIDKLLTKNVPHIHEMIFFSLDHKSYANCKKVSNMWIELLTSISFQRKANSIYIQEKVRNEKILSKCRIAQKVKYLLSTGVDPNCEDSWGITPLYCASKNGEPAVVKLLLDAGADPNKGVVYKVTSNNMSYPLHVAVEWASKGAKRQPYTSVVKLLLDAGANPNKTDGRYGFTPLHYTTNKCNIEMAKLLLKAGADPNTRDTNRGRTPLHTTLQYFDNYISMSMLKESQVIKMFEVLLKAGVQPCTVDFKGESARDLAKAKGYTKVLKLLEDVIDEAKNFHFEYYGLNK